MAASATRLLSRVGGGRSSHNISSADAIQEVTTAPPCGGQLMELLGVQDNFEERLSTSIVKCRPVKYSPVLYYQVKYSVVSLSVPVFFLRYLECYFVSSGDSMSCIGSRKLEDLINLEDVLMMLLGW